MGWADLYLSPMICTLQDKLNLNIDNYNGIKNLEMQFVSQKMVM